MLTTDLCGEDLSKLHAGTLKQPKSHRLSAAAAAAAAADDDDDDDEWVTESFSAGLSD